MTEELVLLECITDNPYQPRTTDDASHIESLARSIAADGLLQKPTARHTVTGFQLAFGHSRRKAFEWLRENWEKEGLRERYNNYSQMPLIIEELGEEDMYRQAVTENVQRKDLDPIETARAMDVYRTQFGKSSKEIGELFGMNESTVRGKLRLLDLPNDLQTKLSSGEISEGLGRVLLSMQKLASTQDLLEALEEANENQDEAPSYVIERFVSNMHHVKFMYRVDGKDKPKSEPYGRRGWALDLKKFPNQYLPELDSETVIDALRVRDQNRDSDDVKRAISLIEGWVGTGGAEDNNLETANIKVLSELDPQYLPKLTHLVSPPGCSACPFYAVIDSSHYCGMKACHTRKAQAWAVHRLEKMVKDLGIPMYQPSDGKFRIIDTYSERGVLENNNQDVRILPKHLWNGHAYQNFTDFDSELGWLVLTGETLKKRAEEKKQKNKSDDASYEIDDEVILEQAEHILCWKAAEGISRLFDNFSEAAIDMLQSAPYGWRSYKFLDGQEPVTEREQRIMKISRQMVGQKLDELTYDADIDVNTAQQIAEILITICSSAGVIPPTEITTIAAEFDAQISDAHTKTGKKKK